LAENHLKRRLFGSLVRRILALALPTGWATAAGKRTNRRKEGGAEGYEQIAWNELFMAFPHLHQAEPGPLLRLMESLAPGG
jgi:hypothetical protein